MAETVAINRGGMGIEIPPVLETPPHIGALNPNDPMVRTNSIAPDIIAETKRPDLAFAVVQIAVKREAVSSERLRKLTAGIKEQLGDIDYLLELNKELITLPEEQSSHKVTDKMRNLIATLEIHKIQIWTGKDQISKEELAALKAQIGAQIDKLRNASQSSISTEIQPEINILQAIMNIVQQIIKSTEREKEKALQLPR